MFNSKIRRVQRQLAMQAEAGYVGAIRHNPRWIWTGYRASSRTSSQPFMTYLRWLSIGNIFMHQVDSADTYPAWIWTASKAGVPPASCLR